MREASKGQCGQRSPWPARCVGETCQGRASRQEPLSSRARLEAGRQLEAGLVKEEGWAPVPAPLTGVALLSV
jgi:hypothetical protein